MTPEAIRAARAMLGLSAAGMAAALRMGVHGGRTVRRWERGDLTPSGTVELAIELLLAQHAAREGQGR